MKSAAYLYDLDTKKLAAMNYEDALHAKVNAAREVMKGCSARARTALTRKDPAAYAEELNRYLAAQKAVDFNLTLLKELI